MESSHFTNRCRWAALVSIFIAFTLQGCGDPTGNPNGDLSRGGDSCSKAWEQCGGIGWSGPTCCVAGLSCDVKNDHYHQCLSNGQNPTPDGGNAGETGESTPTDGINAGGWESSTIGTSHYWDCSGQACDSEPWVGLDKWVSPPGYAPQDPDDFGGALYGEKIWMTGAASDALSAMLGANDECCGVDGGRGGCGKCLLIQTPDALEKDWTAVVMKKNRCPPSNALCNGKAHFDIAVPGFDYTGTSEANVCGVRGGTLFDSKAQSATLGKWWETCSAGLAGCADLCNQLPSQYQKGCRLFTAWGWTRGDSPNVKFKHVECPPEFVRHVRGLWPMQRRLAR